MKNPRDHQPENRAVLDSKDLTPEEFKSLCDVFETLLKWDREERAKDEAEEKSDRSSNPA